jgi:hypothetical protein
MDDHLPLGLLELDLKLFLHLFCIELLEWLEKNPKSGEFGG